MKKRTSFQKAFFILTISFLMTSCVAVQSGSGNVVKQNRTVENFNAIEASGVFDIFLRQGDKNELTIMADDNLLESITTDIKNGTLKISQKGSFENPTALKVYLTVAQLTEIELSGACKMTSKNKIVAQELELECSGASHLNLELSSQELEIEASGASKITLSGTAINLNIEASGASKIDAANLVTFDGDLELSGATNVTVNVTKNLKVDASGASSLEYNGQPNMKISSSGASTVKNITD